MQCISAEQSWREPLKICLIIMDIGMGGAGQQLDFVCIVATVKYQAAPALDVARQIIGVFNF